MFSQSADQPTADQSPAPAGMRELPPQPAKPVMPAYSTTPMASPEPDPAPEALGPGADDSVIAVDDHLEGTFTSRGTVVVMGSVKGRIEAVRIKIEDGATVDADVIVDEAIIAGEFTGNLTCRERLEARASGRISGRVETYKLMLHEGASVEGEMHMLSEAPKDASETIRGSASVRGETAKAEAKPETAPAAPVKPAKPAAPAAKPVPSVTPSSSAKPIPAVSGTTVGQGEEKAGSAEAVRSSVVETLRSESTRTVTPRATTSRGYGYSSPASSTSSSRKDAGTTGF